MEESSIQLSKAYKDQVFRMRGESMTRIETFVAAAFAFATTMLVISLGTIPSSIEEFILAVKNIPSFLASSATILWIWHSHADWSRRYGLEDAKTIMLSGMLICVVLVYIYPLRLMMQGFFFQLTGGFFPFELPIEEYWHLRFMFSFYSIGFTVLSVNFWLLYRHSLSKCHLLELTEFELFETKNINAHWLATSCVCSLTLILNLFVPDQFVFYTPYMFALLWPSNLFIDKYYKQKWKREFEN